MANLNPNGDDSGSLAPYRNLQLFSFFNATTWMVALGTPMVLLAGQLGASAFEVGMAYSFVFLLLPAQILFTATLPRFGYKVQMVFSWSVRALFLIVPLGLAALAPEQPERWMVLALIGALFCFCLFRSIGSCGVMPWFYSLLPDPIRGKYFSTDQFITGLAGILTLLFCALLFNLLPIYEAFFWQYLFAIVGSYFAVWYLTRIPKVDKPAGTSVKKILRQTPKFCLERGPFRQFLVFMGVANLVQTTFVPFVAYYLQVEANFGADEVMVLTAVQYAGAIFGAAIMRNKIDRIGVKPVFRFSLIISICIMTFWYFLVSGYTQILFLLPFAYFLFGISASNWVVANLKYMPRVCSEENRALAVSVHSSVVGIIGGLAPMFWGTIIKTKDGAGIRLEWFAIYFLTVVVIQLGLLLYVGKLTSQFRERKSLHAGTYLLRPFRYVGALVNLVEEKK